MRPRVRLSTVISIAVVAFAATLGGGARAQHKPTEAAPSAAPANPAPPPVDPSRGDKMRAYHAAFQTRRLGSQEPMGLDYVRRRVAEAEGLRQNGRNDEAASRLTEIVEHPQFEAFAENDEGRAAIYLLGDTLATMGAYEPARGYLRKLLAQRNVSFAGASHAARAVRRLTDIALETQRFAVGLEDLKSVPPTAPEEIRGEVAYLGGRARESSDPDGAINAFGTVPPRSRFWAQANYLAGLIHVERGRLRAGENLFCRVADPKRESRITPAFGDTRFFAVRDLARLGLGRIAHEEGRFDDARYYYYLVPRDSDRLAEALYESATTRYEKKDYPGARELLDELRSMRSHHPYEDEMHVLDAYVDLAQCKFPEADQKLATFISRYEPVRDAARRISGDDRSLQGLLSATRGAPAPAPGIGGASPEALATIASLVRVDPVYGQAVRQRAVLDREASGLRLATRQLEDLSKQLATSAGVRPALADAPTPRERGEDVRAAIDGLRREIEALEAARVPAERTAGLRQELALLEERAAAGRSGPAAAEPSAGGGRDLPDLLNNDAAQARALAPEVERAQRELARVEAIYARDALRRLDLRLSRLLRRARLGRIESVLGKKRALEVEVEAIANGYLPSDAVDSLEAARYLRDDEEYWPFEGDDWPDEYVGSEGLK